MLPANFVPKENRVQAAKAFHGQSLAGNLRLFQVHRPCAQVVEDMLERDLGEAGVGTIVGQVRLVFVTCHPSVEHLDVCAMLAPSTQLMNALSGNPHKAHAGAVCIHSIKHQILLCACDRCGGARPPATVTRGAGGGRWRTAPTPRCAPAPALSCWTSSASCALPWAISVAAIGQHRET